MLPLAIAGVDFRPWWCQENKAIVAMIVLQFMKQPICADGVKGRGGVDQAPVEKYPAIVRDLVAIHQRHGDGAAGKCLHVDPWKGRPVAEFFLSHDAATGLLHGRMTASEKLLE